MAGDDETAAEDRTEEPSPRRLEDARREGRVPVSKDVAAAAGLLVGVAATVAGTPTLLRGAVDSFRQSVTRLGSVDAAAPLALAEVVRHDATALLAPGLVVVAGVAVAALSATLAMTGGGVWVDQASPDPSRAFSPSKVLHAFTRQGLADTGVSFVKALAVAVVVARALWKHRDALHHALVLSPGALLSQVGELLLDVVVSGTAVLVVAAAIDLMLTRRRYFGELRMTKEELKRELKEDEGDPHIKSARKRRHRELRRGAVRVEVPRADAVVVNPTHIAVAIRYRKKADRAPRVVAKGRGAKADMIRAIAREHGVPIVRDVPLARLLHKRVKVGREVPAEAWRAVAAVLTFVYKTTGRIPGTGPD